MKPLFSLLLLFVLSFGGLHAANTAPKTILFFGDSLSAGYGLDDASTQAFPALIQKKITAAGINYRVINAGLSGETTAGGLRRIDWVLRVPIDIFVLELGGNDGLRGLPPALAAQNLQGIIAKLRVKNPKVKLVIAGMQMPASMGADYTREFAAIYPALAKANDATLIPFLLDGVGGVRSLNQPDGIHPNEAGHQIVADTVWKILKPLL
ncbi:MAG: arylesterase [Opitutaceae bacterium]|jgi:acyl-CoA thioesterase-1